MRPEEQQVEVPKRETKPAQDFVHKDPPRPSWKPEFDILPSALARKDPTLLPRVTQHHLYTGTSCQRQRPSPQGKSGVWLDRPAPGQLVSFRVVRGDLMLETRHLTHLADDGKPNRMPSAWIISSSLLPTGKFCSKSCSQCGSLFVSASGSLLPGAEVLQNEHQNRRSRSRPPAFGNHFQFAAREFFQPVQSNAAVISWVLMKRVAERCDQTEISAVC
jgi:hypothetical protein